MIKNFLKVALFTALMGFASCSSCKGDKDVQPVTEPVLVTTSVNKLIAQDLKSVKDTFPGVIFYESQVVLNKPVTENCDTVDEVCNVYQAGEWSYQFVHTGDSSRVIKVHDYWCEDIKINPDSVISLDSAITRLQMADIVKPNSKLVVLRNPLGPKIQNPGYFFGQTSTGFVKVDGVNSDVTSVK